MKIVLKLTIIYFLHNLRCKNSRNKTEKFFHALKTSFSYFHCVSVQSNALESFYRTDEHWIHVPKTKHSKQKNYNEQERKRGNEKQEKILTSEMCQQWQFNKIVYHRIANHLYFPSILFWSIFFPVVFIHFMECLRM